MTTAMASEIAEQPEAIARTLDALLPMRSEIRRLAGERRQVLFVARGTSDNAAVYGRYLVEIHAGRGAALAAPSLATHYQVHRDLSDTLVVSVSQSGETTEIVETQAWARAAGAATVAITNVEDSPLVDGADLALCTRAGPERAVPATKSHTTQLTAIAVVADALAPGTGGAGTTPLEDQLRRVPAEIQRLLAEVANDDAPVDALASSPWTLVSGRGLTYGAALELALKLEETCLRPVRGLSYADLRHGPIAVVDPGITAVVVAAPDGPMLSGLTGLAGQLRDLGATTLGVGGDAGFRRACDAAVEGPDLPEEVAPIALLPPGQVVVEALARRLGLDPDAPRGLSKVATTDPGSADGAGHNDAE